MSTPATIFTGTVHGRTIELDHEPGLPEGQQVTVTVLPAAVPPSLPPGEGLRRSAGAWADDAKELDEYLEWSRQQRKQGRRGLEP